VKARQFGFAVVMVLSGCAAEAPPEKPAAPDVTRLLERFTHPDGILDADAAQMLVEDGIGDAVLLAALSALMLEFTDVQTGIDEATEEIGGDSQGLRAAPAETAGLIGQRRFGLNLEAGAWARLTHVCRGLGTDRIDRSKGLLRLQTVLDLLDIAGAPLVIWGTADACALDTEGDESRLDADITAAWLQDGEKPLLVAIDGALASSDGISDFNIELQQLGMAGFEIRREVPGNGGFLIGLETLDADTTVLTLEDADGVWTCQLAEGNETGQCTRGDEVLSWP